MKACTENLLMSIFKIAQGIFHTYCQNKDMADFVIYKENHNP